ncbi:MAG: hypothetical protein J6Y78_15550 [Paludibacteraceae bacterium]|nr:hypothetical protein [Paludibacteraceae bacterium]
MKTIIRKVKSLFRKQKNGNHVVLSTFERNGKILGKLFINEQYVGCFDIKSEQKALAYWMSALS